MMFFNEKLSTHDPNFQSKTLWLLMYVLFSPVWGFPFCLTRKQDIYTPPLQSQLPSVSYCLFLFLNCKSKTSAFCYCCSTYLFYCFLVVQLYTMPISLEQESLKTKVPLIHRTWYSRKHKKENELCLVSPLQILNNSFSSLDKINLTLFKCTLRLFKLSSWYLKKILNLEQIYFKE